MNGLNEQPNNTIYFIYITTLLYSIRNILYILSGITVFRNRNKMLHKYWTFSCAVKLQSILFFHQKIILRIKLSKTMFPAQMSYRKLLTTIHYQEKKILQKIKKHDTLTIWKLQLQYCKDLMDSGAHSTAMLSRRVT